MKDQNGRGAARKTNGAARAAFSAANRDLKDLVLLKSLSGKLVYIALLVLSAVVIIRTGRWDVFLFSVPVGLLYTLGYYLTKLNEHLEEEQEKRSPPDPNEWEHMA